jgi:hypothetical protein
MVKIGVPEGSVRQKMALEGLNPDALSNPDAPLSQFQSGALTAAALSSRNSEAGSVASRSRGAPSEAGFSVASGYSAATSKTASSAQGGGYFGGGGGGGGDDDDDDFSLPDDNEVF